MSLLRSRLGTAARAGLAALVLAGAAYAFLAHRRAVRAETALTAAQAAAAAEYAQAGVVRSAAAAADRAQSQALAITVRAQEIEHDIRKAPEAEAALPDGLRDRLRAGLLGLREPGAVAGTADHALAGEPAAPLPAALR